MQTTVPLLFILQLSLSIALLQENVCRTTTSNGERDHGFKQLTELGDLKGRGGRCLLGRGKCSRSGDEGCKDGRFHFDSNTSIYLEMGIVIIIWPSFSIGCPVFVGLLHLETTREKPYSSTVMFFYTHLQQNLRKRKISFLPAYLFTVLTPHIRTLWQIGPVKNTVLSRQAKILQQYRRDSFISLTRQLDWADCFEQVRTY